MMARAAAPERPARLPPPAFGRARGLLHTLQSRQTLREFSANIYLFAAATGLAAWFHNCHRQALAETLPLRGAQRVLFAQTVGYPAEQSHPEGRRGHRRLPTRGV